jgi:hypothetical protein
VARSMRDTMEDSATIDEEDALLELTMTARGGRHTRQE